MRFIPTYLQPNSSFVWPVKAFVVLVVLLALQANPNIMILLTWGGFFAALIAWAHVRNTEPAPAQVADITDTQPIPIIRHIRCPKCKREQFGPADDVIYCENRTCNQKIRIPAPGKVIAVMCPKCETDQEAEEGTRHTCINAECGWTDFVAREEIQV